MSIFDRLFKRGGGAVAERPGEARDCLHASLAPGWENPDDMGVEAKADYFTCTSCGGRFSPEEAKQLRESESARVHGE